MRVSRRPCDYCRNLTWHKRYQLPESLFQSLTSLGYKTLGISIVLRSILVVVNSRFRWICKVCNSNNQAIATRRATATNHESTQTSFSKKCELVTAEDEISDEEELTDFIKILQENHDFKTSGEEELLEKNRLEQIRNNKPKKFERQRDFWKWHNQLYLGGSSRSHEWRERAKQSKIRDGFKCVTCGSEGGKLETDHMIPLSKGGGNNFENLQTLCETCHDLKHKLARKRSLYGE